MNNSNYTSLQHFHHFDEMFQKWRFVANHITNEWLQPEFCSTVFITSMQCPPIEDLSKIILEMNDSNYNSLQLFSSLRGNFLQYEIYSKSHKKCMTLRRLPFNNCHQLDEMWYNWEFVENYIINDWF